MKKNVALYVHIPFCKQKCLYCDFPSYAGREKFMDSYIDALCKEIEEKVDNYIIESIFIGGGTPSYLSDINLKKLLNSINKFEMKKSMEFSIECNPGTVSKEKFKIMKLGGVNRISFGLQSTDNRLLKSIGRIHSYEEFKENYSIARSVGFNNINVDLMFGLPEETLEQWKTDLKNIAELKPEHISAYSLIIEEGTVFHKLYDENKLNLPDEDVEREMYECVKDLLSSYGYKQYEISNYAKEGYECFHNKVYWRCNDYLGVGVSAASYIDGKRIKNIDSIKEYINKISDNKSIIEEIIENSRNDEIEEFVFMGLRMIDGISLSKFFRRFNQEITSIYGKVIDKNISRNLLILKDDNLRLTEKGGELSNIVMSEFIL